MTGRVVALGLDAADYRLVERFAAEGRMPHMAKLMSRGVTGEVSSPAAIGSGAVWPTFASGLAVEEHGVFGEYSWDPQSMTLKRPDFAALRPFWRDLADRGCAAAVLDVPFAPVVGHERLIEIVDWGAHDWLGGPCVVSPDAFRQRLGPALADHPYVTQPGPGSHATTAAVRRSVLDASLAGARLRGDLIAKLCALSPSGLVLAVFPETHHASHALWDEEGDALAEVFTAVDEQIGRVLSLTGRDASVIVFSLHGMQPACGVPDFLADVLERWGYQRRRPLWRRSAHEHAAALARHAKRRVPAFAKAAYYRRVPKNVTLALAQPNMDVLDWTETSAFALPTDQHGWVRVNLRGREAEGIVEPSAYGEICDALTRKISSLRSPEGSLVRDVVRTARSGHPPALLPDLVVHWSEVSRRSEIVVCDPPLRTSPLHPWIAGQHDDRGFYVADGPAAGRLHGGIDAGSIGAWIASALE